MSQRSLNSPTEDKRRLVSKKALRNRRSARLTSSLSDAPLNTAPEAVDDGAEAAMGALIASDRRWADTGWKSSI